jgi:hypothetical protein
MRRCHDGRTRVGQISSRRRPRRSAASRARSVARRRRGRSARSSTRAARPWTGTIRRHSAAPRGRASGCWGRCLYRSGAGGDVVGRCESSFAVSARDRRGSLWSRRATRRDGVGSPARATVTAVRQRWLRTPLHGGRVGSSVCGVSPRPAFGLPVHDGHLASPGCRPRHVQVRIAEIADRTGHQPRKHAPRAPHPLRHVDPHRYGALAEPRRSRLLRQLCHAAAASAVKPHHRDQVRNLRGLVATAYQATRR